MVQKSVELDADKGCSIADLQRSALQFGLECTVLFFNPEGDFHDLPTPCILHLPVRLRDATGHSVVVASQDKKTNEFAVIDPEFSHVLTMSCDHLARLTDGYVLVPNNLRSRNWLSQICFAISL